MNYYERHLGDYSKNAAHLSLLEHGVYVRLMDVYYAREGPIPESRAARLIGAATPETLQALQDVLQEFFELRDGFWHQDRCNEEIDAYRQGEPEREVKKANEDNRLKRHRDERAKLFKIITDAGQHALWNIGIIELRKLAEECVAGVAGAVAGVAGSGPETRPATQTATAPATPATATHSPLPTTQYPVVKKEEERAPGESGEEAAKAATPVTKPETAAATAGAICKAIRHRAKFAEVNPGDIRFTTLIAQGVTEDEFVGVATEAVDGGKSWAWILKVVERRRNDAGRINVRQQQKPADPFEGAM